MRDIEIRGQFPKGLTATVMVMALPAILSGCGEGTGEDWFDRAVQDRDLGRDLETTISVLAEPDLIAADGQPFE